MCLIVLAVESHPEYPLILLANRDEYYRRPTAALHSWPEAPDLLAGRDQQHGGTWAGWKGGRLAALTNIRRPDTLDPGRRSRGELPLRFLNQPVHPETFARELAEEREEYAPFNMICGSFDQLNYFSSDDFRPVPLAQGVHGLSNASLDTPWPKLELTKQKLAEQLSAREALESDTLFSCMAHSEEFSDDQLPDTGVPIEWERTLSPPFIHSEQYGTRSTLLLMVDRSGNLTLRERSFYPNRGPLVYLQRDYTRTVIR